MCDCQDTLLILKPLDGERVEIKATGTRDQIREAVGAPNRLLDWQSDAIEWQSNAVAAMQYALEHENLTTGTKLLFRDVLANVPQ